MRVVEGGQTTFCQKESLILLHSFSLLNRPCTMNITLKKRHCFFSISSAELQLNQPLQFSNFSNLHYLKQAAMCLLCVTDNNIAHIGQSKENNLYVPLLS